MWRDFPKACNGGDLTTRGEREGLLLAGQHTCPINTASIGPQQPPLERAADPPGMAPLTGL